MYEFDIAIIGGGPAGLSAAIYALRANKTVVIMEKSAIGGQALYSFEVQNYPSYENITGWDLMNKMKEQAVKLGVKIINSEVTKLNKTKNYFEINHLRGTITARTIILSMGANAKALSVPGERELTGKGVSYCATCDGGLFKNKTVAVVGGGNTAFEDILYLSEIANKVYSIHRTSEYRANAELIERVKVLEQSGKVEMLTDCVSTAILGQEHVTAIKLQNMSLDKDVVIDVDAVFVAIGRQPDNELISDLLKLENGYIVTNECMQTSVEGIYAAGDIRKTPLRQIITACADGAIAASYAIK